MIEKRKKSMYKKTDYLNCWRLNIAKDMAGSTAGTRCLAPQIKKKERGGGGTMSPTTAWKLGTKET